MIIAENLSAEEKEVETVENVESVPVHSDAEYNTLDVAMKNADVTSDTKLDLEEGVENNPILKELAADLAELTDELLEEASVVTDSHTEDTFSGTSLTEENTGVEFATNEEGETPLEAMTPDVIEVFGTPTDKVEDYIEREGNADILMQGSVKSTEENMETTVPHGSILSKEDMDSLTVVGGIDNAMPYQPEGELEDGGSLTLNSTPIERVINPAVVEVETAGDVNTVEEGAINETGTVGTESDEALEEVKTDDDEENNDDYNDEADNESPTDDDCEENCEPEEGTEPTEEPTETETTTEEETTPEEEPEEKVEEVEPTPEPEAKSDEEGEAVVEAVTVVGLVGVNDELAKELLNDLDAIESEGNLPDGEDAFGDVSTFVDPAEEVGEGSNEGTEPTEEIKAEEAEVATESENPDDIYDPEQVVLTGDNEEKAETFANILNELEGMDDIINREETFNAITADAYSNEGSSSSEDEPEAISNESSLDDYLFGNY